MAETNALTALVIGIDNTSHGWLRKLYIEALVVGLSQLMQ